MSNTGNGKGRNKRPQNIQRRIRAARQYMATFHPKALKNII